MQYSDTNHLNFYSQILTYFLKKHERKFEETQYLNISVSPYKLE